MPLTVEQFTVGEFWSFPNRIRKLLGHSFQNVIAVVQLDADPISPVFLRCLKSRSAASERIQYQIFWVGGNQYRPLRNHQLEFIDIDTWSYLEFLVPIWRGVVPEIGEIQTVGIQFVPVSSIVSDFLPTVATGHDRNAQTIEGLGFPLGVVEQSIMRRIQSLPTDSLAAIAAANPPFDIFPGKP